ncbi:MAG: RNA methyltransferase [Candidatus Zixiibacteriota bacterium]
MDPQQWPVVSHRRLSEWHKLGTRKGRAQTGLLLIEGVRLVGEAMLSGQDVECVMAADDDQGLAGMRHLAFQVGQLPKSVLRVARRDFEKLADTRHAAGVAALLRWHPQSLTGVRVPPERDCRVLICDHIADPGNLGTLIRAAAGLGIDRIIITAGSVELTNPKTVRATAGALFHLPVHDGVDAPEAASWCRDSGLAILIADAHRGKIPDSGRPVSRWALVLGGETIPHDPVWGTIPADRLHVPLRHGVESLNVAVAGALLIDRLTRHQAGHGGVRER